MSGFQTKRSAEAWAAKIESDIMAGVRGEIPDKTVSDLLDRYLEEVTPEKKGKRWENIRIQAIKRDRIALVRLRSLDSPHVSEWQQRRLKDVSGASVRRDRNLLSHAFSVAVNEWKWLAKNPFTGVRRPADSKPRERIATGDEIQTLLKASSGNLGRAIQAALETGMRASEIPAAKVEGNVAILEDGKNGEGRKIPLSVRAKLALECGVALTAGSISTQFAELTKKCGIKGLTFHDLRHTAITRLAKKLNPFELAKMVGHKDLKMTLNVYYRMDAEETAKKLDQ